jgi:hypothetical protein
MYCRRHTPLIEKEPKSRLQIGYTSTSGVLVCHSLVPNLSPGVCGYPSVTWRGLNAGVLIPVEKLVRPVHQPVQVVEWPSGRRWLAWLPRVESLGLWIIFCGSGSFRIHLVAYGPADDVTLLHSPLHWRYSYVKQCAPESSIRTLGLARWRLLLS